MLLRFLLLICLVLASCAQRWPLVPTATWQPYNLPLAGQVRWQEPSPKTILVTTVEIASAATVALIDPASGQTVATTLTSPTGAFSLALPSWRPQDDKPYLLEAVKGMAAGGNPNRAGAAA
ncbi:MAG: hypothetical protein HY692_05255, partial [Cyanobacteria bacterium NC_groundwater_1444_Ag_S-0.65um_54_12]|nr:hypothetical protein [Cyanobacteria bacterium NC_groundwater_1444_Ag_S-0.65um_54_12]